MGKMYGFSCDWFKREIWFAGLKRGNVIRCVAGIKSGLLVIQVILTAYWFSMWTYRLSQFRAENDFPRQYSDFLTNWNDTIIFLHLLYHLILLVSGIKNTNLDDPAPWYYYVHQLLYELALVLALLVTLVNYLVLEDEDRDVGGVHSHMMNTAVMGIQFLVLNMPFRVFHIIYVWAFGMIYVLNTYIAYLVNEDRDDVYKFINWKLGYTDWILDTWGTIGLFCFGGLTLLHIIFYLLHLLKFYIRDKACERCEKSKEQSQARGSSGSAHGNAHRNASSDIRVSVSEE